MTRPKYVCTLMPMSSGAMWAIKRTNAGFGMSERASAQDHTGLHLGRRKDEVFEELQSSLSHLPIKHWYTDNWATYSRAIPVWQGHSSHKMYMQKFERQNLNFRTHIKRLGRKTICFSKSEEVHDKVIGAYIEEYCFKAGTFKKAMEMRGKENKKTDHL